MKHLALQHLLIMAHFPSASRTRKNDGNGQTRYRIVGKLQNASSIDVLVARGDSSRKMCAPSSWMEGFKSFFTPTMPLHQYQRLDAYAEPLKFRRVWLRSNNAKLLLVEHEFDRFLQIASIQNAVAWNSSIVGRLPPGSL